MLLQGEKNKNSSRYDPRGQKNKKIPIKKTRCLDNVLKTEPVSTPLNTLNGFVQLREERMPEFPKQIIGQKIDRYSSQEVKN